MSVVNSCSNASHTASSYGPNQHYILLYPIPLMLQDTFMFSVSIDFLMICQVWSEITPQSAQLETGLVTRQTMGEQGVVVSTTSQ